MLVYEHERTERIIDRLRRAETFCRTILMVTAVLAFGFGAAYLSGAVVGGILGAVLGFLLSSAAAGLLSASVEWKCQQLIALGALVEAGKRQR